MQIKMSTTASGPNGYYARGQVYDLPNAKARELISARFATVVATPPAEKREKASRPAAETR
jgi:hypothetical protein